MLHLGDLRFPVPSVMGVLNVTPDSFSDGGRFMDVDIAKRHAERMATEGAAIIDIGGESTRPGAMEIDSQQELDRVVPVIEAVRRTVDLPISIDTSRADVMRASVAAGASIINDVQALQAPGSMRTAADLGVPVCLMHMQGRPRTMQEQPSYENVTREVLEFLRERISACVQAGIARDRIVIDPGFGFGKTHAHNVELLANLRQLLDLGLPMLVGLSRKSTLGVLTGQTVENRMAASIAAATIAVMMGAKIVRAHDVRETADALRLVSAVMEVEYD